MFAYEMYAEPSTSLRDILKYFREHEDEVGYKRTDEYGGKKGEHNSNTSGWLSRGTYFIRTLADSCELYK